ncbi:MAG TPA: DUF4412 domain-containing protein [Verrucomicrobiae bacterium]|jgi:hypothetical protein
MKHYLSILMVAALVAGILPSHAQMSGPPVPQFSGGMEKLFGDNQTFSADTRIQISNGSTPMTMPGKIAFDKGNSWFELDMSQMQGGNIPAQVLTMMKSAGLDKMVSITQSNKPVVYVVYPNAKAYAEMTSPTPDTASTNADVPVQVTALGNETMAGHPCVKNKATVTDKQGVKHDFTVWNATDLKNFPVQITMTGEENPATFTFLNVSFAKPNPGLFTPPTGFTQYDGIQEMMQSIMFKSLGSGVLPGGAVPQQPPQQ